MANKLRDEDLNLNIIVNGDKGKKELGDLEKSTRELTNRNKELRLEKEKLVRAGKQESDEYKDISKEITANNAALKTNETRMIALRKAIGLTGLTAGQLRSELTRLTRLRDSSTFGTEQWKKYNAELEKVDARLKQVRGGSKNMQMSIGKMADGFNRYFAMLSVWAASVVGVVLGFKKATNAFAEFDDQVADIQKTTQLSKEEVLEIDKALQEIDTRTAQEELLGLARVAGKLGEDTKEGVEEFVRGADKIAVALTEDLGGNIEESVNDLGKLIDIFKLKDDFGLEASLMKVGSAINDLGASGTANEGYIVEFTKRVAGIAPSAGISIENVMGLAATLDQLGQTSEVASTVYSQVVPDMFKDTATYANIAKMSVGDFTELLNTDSNAAFIRFLEGLNGNNGGLAEMTAKLDGLGLEGKRSISVLGVLANNTETLREQQDLSTKSFENGSSLIAEFNIKNESMQGQLDKSRKELALITRELGEKLSPAMLVSTNGITYFIRGMVIGIRVFNEHKGTILGAAAGIAAYTIAIKVAAYWDTIHYGYLVTKTAVTNAYRWAVGLLTGQVTLATAAQNAWNIAQKANPIGLVIGLLTAAATAYFVLKGKVKEATVEQKRFNDEVERGKELMGQTKTLEERGKIMTTMNKRQLEEFKGSLEDQIKVEEDFHSKLLTEAKKTLDADAKLQELYNNRKAKGLSEMQKIGINAQIAYRERELTRELQDQDNASQKRLKQLKKYNADAANILKGNTGGGGGILNEEEQKKASDKALAALDAFQNELMGKLVDQYVNEGMTDAKFKLEQERLEIDFLFKKQARLQEFGQSTVDVDKEINDRRIKAQKDFNDAMAEADKEFLKNQQTDEPLTAEEAGIDPGYLVSQEDLVFASRKHSLDEWVDYLAKKSKEQFDIKAKQIDDEKALQQAREELQDAQIGGIEQIAGALAGMFEQGSAAQIAFFALEKAMAIAQVWVNYARESSAINMVSAAMGPAGIAWAAMMQPKALINAGVNTAIIAAQAVAQVASSKKSETKDYWEGGFTSSGAWDKPQGVVHSNEFVANRFATKNPNVRQFLDIFDYYQKTGQISRLNTGMIMANLPVQQMYVGGYAGKGSSSKAQVPSAAPVMGGGIQNEQLAWMIQLMEKLDSWEPVVSIEEYERKRENWKKVTSGGLK